MYGRLILFFDVRGDEFLEFVEEHFCQEMLMDSHDPQLLKSGFDWKAQTKRNQRVLSIRETFIYLHLFVELQYSITLACSNFA